MGDGCGGGRLRSVAALRVIKVDREPQRLQVETAAGSADLRERNGLGLERLFPLIRPYSGCHRRITSKQYCVVSMSLSD